MKLAHTTALVTGGSAGIGLALARILVEEGATVVLVARDPQRLQAATDQLGPAARGITADLSQPEELARLGGALRQQLDHLDLLVNNAGLQVSQDLALALDDPAAVDLAAMEAEVALNLLAPARLTVELLPLLRGRPQATVLNITSALALAPKQASPMYCASKAGLRSLSKALRWQLAEHGIRVVEALPPVVDTAMTAGRDTDKLSPEACAAEIVAGLRADRDEIRVGKVKLLAAVQRLSPALAERILRHA